MRGILTRSRRETVTFRHPFRIKGIDRQLQAGAYEVVTDDEMIENFGAPSNEIEMPVGDGIKRAGIDGYNF